MTRPPPSRSTPPAKASEDVRLPRAFESVPRDWFGATAEHGADQSGSGSALPPEEVARSMMQALELTGVERALDVGSRTGYLSALLSRLVHEVVSVERDTKRAASRREALAALGCANVRVVVGDSTRGWWATAPYDVIVVGSGAPKLPAALVNQLSDGGRLVVALGDEQGQLLELMRKHEGGIEAKTLGPCHLKVLPEAEGCPSPYPWAQHETR